MKKIFFFVLFLSTFFDIFSTPTIAQQQAIDAYFDHTYDYTFVRNDAPREVSPILIIDNNGKSVKSAFGIRIIIPVELHTLWDPLSNKVIATGTAVTNKKMDSEITPVFSDNLKEAYIQVKSDFAAGGTVSLEGLKMRVYKIANDKRYLELDLNGDRVSDVSDLRWIAVSGTEIRTDTTPTLPVTNAKAHFDGVKVLLTWKDPVDLDFDRVMIEKIFVRDKKESNTTFEAYAKDQLFADLDVKKGDQITYKLFAKDGSGLLSDVVMINLLAEEKPATQPVTSFPEETKQPASSDASVTQSPNIPVDSGKTAVSEQKKKPVVKKIPKLCQKEKNKKKKNCRRYYR